MTKNRLAFGQPWMSSAEWRLIYAAERRFASHGRRLLWTIETTLRAAGIHMDINSIRKMSKQEKLRAMEALWDSLTQQVDEPASPSWHREILAARRARIDAGEASFVSLDELKALSGE